MFIEKSLGQVNSDFYAYKVGLCFFYMFYILSADYDYDPLKISGSH